MITTSEFINFLMMSSGVFMTLLSFYFFVVYMIETIEARLEKWYNWAHSEVDEVEVLKEKVSNKCQYLIPFEDSEFRMDIDIKVGYGVDVESLASSIRELGIDNLEDLVKKLPSSRLAEISQLCQNVVLDRVVGKMSKDDKPVREELTGHIHRAK